MKKIFTLIVACVATLSAFAQTSSMNFIGNSNYSATVYGMTISGAGVKDTLKVGDSNTSITFPSMTVDFMGSAMTVPSMKIANLTYKMEGNPMQGNAVFTWDKGAKDTTVYVYYEGEYKNKKLKITSLHAVYTHATGQLETTFLFQFGSMPGVVTFTSTGYYTIDNAWKLVGRGTAANPYRIFEAADFTAMASKISSTNTGSGEYFQVMNDIDFGGSESSAVQLPAIGKAGITSITTIPWGFQGTFDGNGKTISGIYHTNNGNDANGKFNALFSSLGEGGVVKNLTFTANNSIKTYNYGAPFVCLNKGGSIENCLNSAPVTCANAFAAGICGYLVGGKGTVKNCTNYGEIKATTYASGICSGTQSGKTIGTKDAEYQNYILEDCTNYGNCSSTNGTGSAGIAGSYSGVVTNCTNYGTIDDATAGKTTGQNTGGIVSCMTYVGGVSGNTNAGTVKGVKSVAGIVGKIMSGTNEVFDLTNNNTNTGVIEANSAFGQICGATARTNMILTETRSNAENTYGTICLPYAATSTGVVLFEMNGKTEKGIKFSYVGGTKEKATNANLEAGVPYLYCATATTQTFSCPNLISKVTEASQVNYFVGTFENKVSVSDVYVLSTDDNLFHPAGDNVDVDAYKCYINTNNLENLADADASAAKAGVELSFSDVPTAINNVDANVNANVKADGKFIMNGKLVIVKNGKQYNAAGAQMK